MGTQELISCFICNKEVTAYRFAETSRTEFDCDLCGKYYVSDLLKSESAWIRPIMFYCLQHDNSGRQTFFVLNEPNNKNEYDNARFITKDALENMRPKNHSEKIDMIMLNLGIKLKQWGNTFSTAPKVSSAAEIAKLPQKYELLFVCDTIVPRSVKNSNLTANIVQINAAIKILEEYEYLRGIGSSSHNMKYTFTAKGWKRLGELQAKNRDLPQAFIAMWFPKKDKRSDNYERMELVREHIVKAVVDSGYKERLIDEKEHNNQIVPEIFYEIQNSKFVVADLCGHRNGVYYEAGYAKGLGKEVILTCRKDHFKKRHFDVAQQSIVVYEDNDDLYKRLMKRIKVTVGTR